MKRTRVVFSIGALHGGGSERQIVSILKQIDRARFEPILYLVYRQERGERPEKLLTGDLPLFLSVAGYGAVVGWVVYL